MWVTGRAGDHAAVVMLGSSPTAVGRRRAVVTLDRPGDAALAVTDHRTVTAVAATAGCWRSPSPTERSERPASSD